ncbi:MAG: metal ABC transporter substrate-binding protein [Acidimicrobiia bacterium]|nr:metal ABC transporter substrate-binding protein [Acidimicrobiia bacterium]
MIGKSWFRLVGVVMAATVLISCGSDDSQSTTASQTEPTAAVAGETEVPHIVVSTNIVGNVVSKMVGDLAEVTVIMPVGSDPHSFQPSAQQVALMTDADALIFNGAGFEENLVGAIEAAAEGGTPTFAAISAVSVLDFGEHAHAHDEHDDEHDDEDVAEDNPDPHFFTDPVQMVAAADEIADFLATAVPTLATDEFDASASAYISELESLHDEVSELLAVIPAENRVLITNHEVFAYFAEQYDFEVAGTVIPGGSTSGAASAEGRADLVELIEDEGVPAIFADTSSSSDLSETLVAEVDREIQIVELFSESLGDSGSGGESYIDMVRTNATRIADALA